jgi:hypothetical protein
VAVIIMGAMKPVGRERRLARLLARARPCAAGPLLAVTRGVTPSPYDAIC